MTLARPAGAFAHGTHVLVLCDVFFGSCAARLRQSSAGVLPILGLLVVNDIGGVHLIVSLQVTLPPIAPGPLAIPSRRRNLWSATTVQIRRAVVGTDLEAQIADATDAIQLARFTTRPIRDNCAMAGITLEGFTQSVPYEEIFGR